MIHLIDRIYVEYAEAKPMPQNPLIKPEAYIRIVDRGMMGMVDVDTEDKNLFNCKTVDEAFAMFGGPSLFLNHLIAKCGSSEAKKIIIYADEAGTIKLLSALWKTIFPNLTSEGAYKLYQTYKDFEYFKPKDQINFIAFDEDSREIQKSHFFDKYWSKSLKDFQELYNPMPRFDLTDSQKSKIGTEYLMIKYIINPAGNHSSLFSKIDHFYKKNLMKEIVGLKAIGREYIYNILATEEDDRILLSDKSVVDRLKTHTKYALLLDDQIVYSIKGYEHLKTKYSLIKACTDLSNAEVIAFRSMGIEQEKKDIACTTFIVENHREPDLKTVLDDECFYGSNFRLFRELAKKGRYNQYLVYAFAQTAKQGTESLAEFSE